MITILRSSSGVRLLSASLAGCLMFAACGSSESADSSASDSEASAAAGRPTIVVSTNILGDVVENIVGDAASVTTIMPVGSDPHDFQPSAQQIAQLNEADAVIVNGAGFEEGLVDIVEAAEADGVAVHEAISAVDTLELDGDHHDDHSDGDHSDDDHSEGGDPHFFTDPVRMATAVSGISEFLTSEVDGIDASALQAATDEYLAELATLDDDVDEILSAIAADNRVLVTNHEVLAYFADRYDFEIVGTVIPGGTTIDSASAEALAELAEIIESEGIPAVFSDTSSSEELAETLALEAGTVEVVQLYTESLGSPDSDGATYLEMMRSNAERIADALAS